MKSKDASIINKTTDFKNNSSKFIELKNYHFGLIECFLDVPENRLENYIISNKTGYVSELCNDVILAKKRTAILLNTIRNKTKA
jgi:hypothetical protein